MKYLTDRELAKANIDRYGVSTNTNRAIADGVVDAYNAGQLKGYNKGFTVGGIFCGIGVAIAMSLISNKKHEPDEESGVFDAEFTEK